MKLIRPIIIIILVITPLFILAYYVYFNFSNTQNQVNTNSVQLAKNNQKIKKSNELISQKANEPEKIKNGEALDTEQKNGNQNANQQPPASDHQPSAANKALPKKIKYDVPFAPQAPFGDWNMPYQEACEEASMIMAARYFHKQPLDKKIMDEEISRLAKWEEENNYPIDLTAEQIVEILKKYFKIAAYASGQVETEFIKQQLRAGRLIIAPAAGRILPNPHFKQPGPLYHNLVIIGYDENKFIANDPGTKRGEGFAYKYYDLLNAIHDWNGGARIFNDPRPEPDITAGEKRIVVVGGSRN